MLRTKEIVFLGFKFKSNPPDPPRVSCVVCRPHGYPPLIYYLTIRSLFKKFPLPHDKILKKGQDEISNKVVYVYGVSKAVGQTNTVPPPPPPPKQDYARTPMSLNARISLFLKIVCWSPHNKLGISS